MFESQKWYTLDRKTNDYTKDNTLTKDGRDVRFDTFKEAYEGMINQWEKETLAREPHSYWFIKEHYRTKSTDDNGKVYENEMILPVWR
jgi:hypothetical protein